MQSGNLSDRTGRPPSWKLRWVHWRNCVLASPRFQFWAAAFPLTRPIASKRAGQLFDLVAGFTYTQTVLATVESGLLSLLSTGEHRSDTISKATGLGEVAALRLVRAAAALGIAEEVSPGWWVLGEQGAALSSNKGAQAMIMHHKLLYRDLENPLELLRQDRALPTQLAEFWRYAASDRPQGETEDAVAAYSQLMAASQQMVAEQILQVYDFKRHRSLLDVGGGHGAFLSKVADACPDLLLGLFDLPGVIEGASPRLDSLGTGQRVCLHPGNFFANPLPGGYDCISLVRILHDHDDAPAMDLLRAIRAALPVGGTLMIAEPMAGTRGCEAMGDAYFGLYLWTMRSGRPRSASEIAAMLDTAGFKRSRKVPTRQPVITSLVVAST